MRTRYVMLMALLLTAPALASETATVVRATQLTAAPYTDSESHGVLRGEQRVEIMERQGGWYRVATDDGRRGWLRMSSVRLGEAEKAEAGSGFWSSLFSFTGRSQTRTASATTGIRGLSEDEIHNAIPDQAAVARLGTFAADDAQARSFASEIGLAQHEVESLPKTDNKSDKKNRSR